MHRSNPAGAAGRGQVVRNATQRPGRRRFLKGLGGGGLLLWFGVPPAVAAAASALDSHEPETVAGWIRIAPSGAIELLTNTSEIGQGTGTALAQILADELDAEWRSVHLAMAPVEPRYYNAKWRDYATYGSGGVAGQFTALRTVGAQAREMLIAAAAATWEVAAAECRTELGQVVHDGTRRHASYGTLAAAAARQPVPEHPRLKEPGEWRLIGRDLKRLDLPGKVDGSAIFGIDVKLAGLKIAAIRQSPRFGGKLRSVDPAPALAQKGVTQVVPLSDAVAVIAGDYWTAAQGLARLEPEWDNSAASSVTSASYTQALRESVAAGGAVFAPRGAKAEDLAASYQAALGRATSHAEAVYTVPFLSHAPMEPMNATASVSATAATLWLPTQIQSTTAAAVAEDLGLPVQAVTIHTLLSGGGFGRRAEFDFALQAARIARAVGAPVKLIWSREEDMRHDFYRPAVAVRMRAGTGADGRPLGIRFDSACESLHMYSNGGSNRAAAAPVDSSAVGERQQHYATGPTLFAVTTVDVGVPVGYWRSVAASQNTFAYESFVDELAHAAKSDPAAWRRQLLAGSERERRVLDAVLERARWSTPAAAGRFRGVGLVHANGTVVAHVVELSVADRTRIHIHRVTSAVDCGVAVNPNSVRAQIEGGVAFALSAAMYGEITLRDGAVEQSNFNDYPIIRLAEMPVTDIVLLESHEAPGGVGEEAVGPLAPALANALFAATGRRIRELPLARAGFTLSSA